MLSIVSQILAANSAPSASKATFKREGYTKTLFEAMADGEEWDALRAAELLGVTRRRAESAIGNLRRRNLIRLIGTRPSPRSPVNNLNVYKRDA